ncbi:MAG: DNA gyrase subunit B [Candidatus Berkelbacteria bacterium Licking1014_2]|uniref:DNA topoisomerase (ATP-hydrolyzing) n=1 Tax=Candidatus Berkelbacteria bacterium Licking1014_2 TaxID=2017146 RepID=A0A554LUT0_9BACT|nr:MAG: DNA gyrase subunit B [Candidatus Berkelbacteria bacterium Licking1014_2]
MFNETPVYINKVVDDVLVEVAIQYADDFNEHIFCFANNIYTAEGGTHATGFHSALTRVLNDYLKKQNAVKNGESSLSGEDVREGLVAVVSVKLSEPQFEGQTKARLGNPEVRKAVETAVAEQLIIYLEENPGEARRILEKNLISCRARLAARAARETVIRKGALEGMTLPGKLADCSNKRPEESELFIVEGDSAGGSAKQGRNRASQAILPLRGKILNVERARLDRMLTSEEIKNLIVALGVGIGEAMQMEKIRYHRVIIMTDADVDGSHIRTLLLTIFFRHFKEIIDRGYLYIAQPPLYAITSGKDKKYVYSEDDKEKFLADLPAVNRAKISIQRYKGLGEMNPIQLWETTMNPAGRILWQVTIEDAEEADEIFSMLMGDEVLPRKSFIQNNAKEVKNLDV